MSQDDIDNGRLICVIGIAPVNPAEFVIFRIQQKTLEPAAVLANRQEEPPMPPTLRDDPYPGYNFQVIVTGVSDDGDGGQRLLQRESADSTSRSRRSVPQRLETLFERKLPGLQDVHRT